ncbi:hypothetical protein AB0M23_21630 [Streptomyces sp. NPDC052077]|uniref:hypothetical protein n=1 Tax=Streptomyces sp. NPDC052077 TaxID=3154757 RepID=UPI0034370B79
MTTRAHLEAVTTWGVTQSGAASHMKRLTDIIGSTSTAFEGWTHDLDIDGVHVFACSLYLADHPERARFWWRLAAGAGHGAAAYCLHLQHTLTGELKEANHYWEQLGNALADSDDNLDERELGVLLWALEHFAGLSLSARAHSDFPVSLLEEVDRLAGLTDDGQPFRPGPRLADRLRELASH